MKVIVNSSVYEKTEQKIKGNWLRIVLFFLATSALVAFFNKLVGSQQEALQLEKLNAYFGGSNAKIAYYTTTAFIASIVRNVVQYFFTLGIAAEILRLTKGESINFLTLFEAFKKHWLNFLITAAGIAVIVQILSYVPIVGSFMAFFSSAFVLFAGFMIADQETVNIVETLKQSFNLTVKNFLHVVKISIDYMWLVYFLAIVVLGASLPYLVTMFAGMNFLTNAESMFAGLGYMMIFFVVFLIGLALVVLYYTPFCVVATAEHYNLVKGDTSSLNFQSVKEDLTTSFNQAKDAMENEAKELKKDVEDTTKAVSDSIKKD